MKNIKSYIKNYRGRKSNREFIENSGLFFAGSLVCFTALAITEKFFYLSAYSRKKYFILFLIAILISFLSILIKWIISYQGFLGLNTDEKIAKEIGNKSLFIKDRLLNAIQLNKSHRDSLKTSNKPEDLEINQIVNSIVIC